MRKYRNTKVKTPEGVFDSKREFKRWNELKLMQREGLIKDLKRQVRIELIPAQKNELGKVIERNCCYIADFTYYYAGDLVVEDTKGFRTPEYIIKRKLLLYLKGIKVVEV